MLLQALLPLLLLAGPARQALGGAAAPCPEDSLASESAAGGCACIPAWLCPKHDCPEEMQLVRVRDAVPETPGSCCPEYECRTRATLSYDPSEESQAAAHQCTDGQGQPRELGEQWLENDPCTNCSCETGGRARCQITMCRSCATPRPPGPTECCPRCPETPPACPARDCALACKHGLLRDADGCEVCRCRPGPDCPQRLNCNRARCPEGFRADGTSADGCAVCRCLASCLDEDGARRTEAERWSRGPCRSCLCGPAGAVACNDTVCSLGCARPLPPEPGQCCPVCPPAQEAEEGARGGWGTIPIVLVVVLGLLCVLLMVQLARGRFRARLEAREVDLYRQQHQQQQYYKCVPVYEPVLRHAEKIAAL